MVYTIDPTRSAVLLIDVQREYFDEGLPLYTPNAQAIRSNLVTLREAADQNGVQVVIVKHIHKEDGSDVGRMGDFDPTPVFTENTPGVDLIPEMVPTDKDMVVSKTRYSSFVDTPLHEMLQAKAIDTIIVAGLMTNYCSVTTARHAHDLDYKVVFVHDANAGPDMPDLGFGTVTHTEIMRSVATSLAGGVADVVSTAEVLSEMRAGAVPAATS